MISRKKLKSTARQYDNKKHRKNVIGGMKTIESAIKQRAKVGLTSYNITLKSSQGWFFVNLLAVRLFKLKNNDIDVKITLDWDSDEITDYSWFGATYVYINISWS